MTQADHLMTEDQLLDGIFNVATVAPGGWMVYHTKSSRMSEPGFPDLVMVEIRRPYRILFVELKTQTGKYIKAKMGKTRELPGQEEWATALIDSAEYMGSWILDTGQVAPGVTYLLIRPSDLTWFYGYLLQQNAIPEGKGRIIDTTGRTVE